LTPSTSATFPAVHFRTGTNLAPIGSWADHCEAARQEKKNTPSLPLPALVQAKRYELFVKIFTSCCRQELSRRPWPVRFHEIDSEAKWRALSHKLLTEIAQSAMVSLDTERHINDRGSQSAAKNASRHRD
jgi:hypothetical protein